jgi:CRP-like cAMP-binding protein
MELLEGLPEEDVRRVLARCRRRRFKRGEVLFHEGDPADSLHFIVKGRVAVRVSTETGEAATLDFNATGDVVGEQALIPPPSARSATAVAVEATETMALSATEFAALRVEHPSVDAVLLSLLARRQRALAARLVEALYVGSEARVLRRLLAVAETYAPEPDGTVVVPLTQDDVAGLAGTTRETVNRVLRKEVERETLVLARGRITIVDRAGIERRAR